MDTETQNCKNDPNHLRDATPEAISTSTNGDRINKSIVHRLFEPSQDSYFSRNLADDSDVDSDLEARLNATPGFSALRQSKPKRQVQFSEKSRQVIEEANQLLESIEQRSQDVVTIRRSESMHENNGHAPITYCPMQATSFPRIDFDDMLDEELEDRKPAWKQLQENIKSSYRKPKRTVERNRELNETQDLYLGQAYERRRAAARRSQSPFAQLDSESFTPRAPSWFASGAMQPRGLNFTGSGPYAAPAISSSHGLEGRKVGASRYDRLVDDIEARLLKTSILPESMKIVTCKEFRRAPFPGVGSFTEDSITNDEVGIPLPRPYYSRPNRDDPNYFDFDLQHSIDLYRKPEGQYIPRGPQPWENKLLSEVMSKGDAPLSAYMFTKGNPSTSNDGMTAPPPSISQRDWRSTNTSYLSAALRTPAFWEHRFASIGSQVRDSNPVSMDSILRNKPVPNKFTEYRDPDFEDYEDPKSPE